MGVEVCEPMRELRAALDARGIEWRDGSYVSNAIHHEQTLWEHDGWEASVIWAYMILPVGDGDKHPISHGWPEMLECWPHRGMHGEEPAAMTVEEILGACCDG